MLPADQLDATLATAWQIAAAIVAAFGSRPNQRETATPDVSDFSHVDLAEAAIDHGDEPVIKLTEACRRQFDLTGDAVLLAAADRLRMRIKRRW